LNTLTTIQTNLATLLTVNSLVQIYFLMSSFNGLTTPTVSLVTATFMLAGVEPAPPNTCLVYGYLLDISGQPVVGATVTFQLAIAADTYTETENFPIDASIPLSVVTDSHGYFEQMLIQQSQFSGAIKVVNVTIFDKKRNTINLTPTGGPLQIAVPTAVDYNITGLLAG
jgi:hypothetical protein